MQYYMKTIPIYLKVLSFRRSSLKTTVNPFLNNVQQYMSQKSCPKSQRMVAKSCTCCHGANDEYRDKQCCFWRTREICFLEATYRNGRRVLQLQRRRRRKWRFEATCPIKEERAAPTMSIRNLLREWVYWLLKEQRTIRWWCREWVWWYKNLLWCDSLCQK